MQEYRNDKIVVRYDPEICIHAGDCVRGFPKVFDREETVDRRRRRFARGYRRAGREVPVRRAQLRIAKESQVGALGAIRLREMPWTILRPFLVSTIGPVIFPTY